jgi:hypothetical protein
VLCGALAGSGEVWRRSAELWPGAGRELWRELGEAYRAAFCGVLCWRRRQAWPVVARHGPQSGAIPLILQGRPVAYGAIDPMRWACNGEKERAGTRIAVQNVQPRAATCSAHAAGVQPRRGERAGGVQPGHPLAGWAWSCGREGLFPGEKFRGKWAFGPMFSCGCVRLRYGHIFETMPHRSPLDAPSEGLRSPIGGGSMGHRRGSLSLSLSCSVDPSYRLGIGGVRGGKGVQAGFDASNLPELQSTS